MDQMDQMDQRSFFSKRLPGALGALGASAYSSYTYAKYCNNVPEQLGSTGVIRTVARKRAILLATLALSKNFILCRPLTRLFLEQSLN